LLLHTTRGRENDQDFQSQLHPSSLFFLLLLLRTASAAAVATVAAAAAAAGHGRAALQPFAV